jgi:hypothetical protein
MDNLSQVISAKNLGNLNNLISDDTQLVMVKGFMGFPECLKYEEINDNFIVIIGRSGKTRMNLKVKYAYQYDEKLYQKLKEVFESNDTEKLTREWQCAKSIIAS